MTLYLAVVAQPSQKSLASCALLVDNGKCLTIDKQPYQLGIYDGKQAGLIAFFQVDDSCDSTAPAHTDQCIKGHTDAYNGAKETT